MLNYQIDVQGLAVELVVVLGPFHVLLMEPIILGDLHGREHLFERANDPHHSPCRRSRPSRAKRGVTACCIVAYFKASNVLQAPSLVWSGLLLGPVNGTMRA